MNPIYTSQIKQFLFRSVSLYLVFYFFFISDFRGTYPFLQYLNAPFKYIAVALVRLVDNTLLHGNFPGNIYFGDLSWTFIALLVFLVIAVLISLVWTWADKGRSFPSLYKYIYVFSRYYLACLLFIYGTSKLYGNQFTLIPSILMQPVGNLNSHDLFWTFMGASKSYRIFAGLLETIAGIMLLFRRTSTMGALLAIILLTNILILNMAYDTWVKLIAFHLIVFGIVILIPDIRTLFRIFILKQNARLAAVPPVIENQKYKWLQYTLKSVAFGLMIFAFGVTELWNTDGEPPYRNIVGIYEITKFNLRPELTLSTPRPWKRMVINQFDFMTIHYPDDSIARFNFKADTTARSLELRWGQQGDGRSELRYSVVNENEWLFRGTVGNDSVEFTSTKINLHHLELLKGYGKVKWIYD
jgi:hypothetical protein